ncbi:hypothetical protein K458DRAFT_450873 [Lentithecium fluviatile CBS 122367]|uniref:Uncharacterized protein n=1 Tax=Lentithecium fluviatile CBS 122367 TaxID=1168545 RepID=A0A6G1J2Y0_9PLEO|nr:hypothetical protein K458DRAFT_450873 [Lentithecium fluviatile CBS 122367]
MSPPSGHKKTASTSTFASKSSFAFSNKSAVAENKQIPLEEIKALSVAKEKPSRVKPGSGDRLAQAREMAPVPKSVQPRRKNDQGGLKDGGVRLPTPTTAPPSFGFGTGPTATPPIPGLGAIPSPAAGSPYAPNFFQNYTNPASTFNAGTIGQERAAGEIPEDPKKPRKLLAAPLRLLRSSYARNPTKKPLLTFLDAICPPSRELEREIDPILHNVVYAVKYNLSDRELNIYRQMLLQCPIARESQNMLAVGGMEFDQISEMMPTRGLFEQGKDLEVVLRELVEEYRLSYDCDMSMLFMNPRFFVYPQ